MVHLEDVVLETSPETGSDLKKDCYRVEGPIECLKVELEMLSDLTDGLLKHQL